MNAEVEKKDSPRSKRRKLKALFVRRKPPAPAEEGKATATEVAPALPAPAPPEIPLAANEPGGRKKKTRSGSQRRQRTKTIRAACTPDEYDAITALATAAGLSAGGYLRACALGRRTPRTQKRPSVDRELLAHAIAELNWIGNNINQLAHHANLGHSVKAELLEPALEAYAAALKTLLKACGK
jgi:hypothetical protein